jgi:hypothetical protein
MAINLLVKVTMGVCSNQPLAKGKGARREMKILMEMSVVKW